MSFVRYIFFFFVFLCQSQNPYPQDFFSSPLKQTLVLSGTFAELRTNHFHSGIDIKTNGKQGLPVYTAAAGYVSRIKVSRYGYGKALYINHSNGYTSVYAHLQKFSPEIEAYVKAKQYQNESFEIQLFPARGDLKIEANTVVAFSGNTGGSSGPHLHFEIRDKQERPINPMLFGIEVKDTTKPVIYDLFAYPLSEESHIEGQRKRKKIRVIKQSDGNYKTETIKAHGSIGFGIISNDRQDAAPNKNGVALIRSYFNGEKSLEVDFKRFSFDETKHLNRYIDYAYYRDKKQRIQKLFIEKNNPLSLFTFKENNGQLNIKDDTNGVVSIEIKDYKGNESFLKIPINGKEMALPPRPDSAPDLTLINAGKAMTLREGLVWVNIPENSFYEDVPIDFRFYNDTLKLHKSTIPLKKSIDINFNIEKYADTDAKNLFIGSVSDYGKLYHAPTIRKGDILTTRTKYLGTYTLGLDNEGPDITPENFKDGSWISYHRYLKIKISDAISGVNNYRATLNGNWILMEYDPKTNRLTHDFEDGIINSTENNLKLIVTDNVGNSTKFEATFYRKITD